MGDRLGRSQRRQNGEKKNREGNKKRRMVMMCSREGGKVEKVEWRGSTRELGGEVTASLLFRAGAMNETETNQGAVWGR